MRSRRLVAWSVALAVGMALTSCATLPTSGGVQPGPQQSAAGHAQHGVQVVPVPPGSGWGPADIVNGFLAASAAFDGHNHAVAREYLTRGFNRTWNPGWAATIIDSPTVRKLPTSPKINNPGPPTAVVVVTGKRFAKLEAPGQDQAGSVVVSPGLPKYRFSLVQRGGGWRIDGILDNNLKPASPTLLLLSSTDFARDYLPRNLYFYSPRGNALVPDPVYIPQTGPVTEVKGLVNALIHPPPGSSWLWNAATTAFPPKTKLAGTQVIGGITAVITLGGSAGQASRARQQRMAAQLAWSLLYSPYASQYGSQIKSVMLKIKNHSLQPTLAKYATWVPRGAASPLYYQVSGVQAPALAALRTSSTAPLPLPLPPGLGSQPFTAVAVSGQDPPIIAACAGRSLYLFRLAASVEEAKKLASATRPAAVRKQLPADCSSLSWDNSGNLWVTARLHTLVLPTAGATALDKMALVHVYVSYIQTAITTLRVAPDGVRVAMIVGTGSGRRILVAAISRNPSFTFIGQTKQMLRVGSDLAGPVALTWLDADNLLVLSKPSAGRAQLFEVPLNGGESTEIATPPGVSSVAANWPNGQTAARVVIGIAPTVSSPGKIEMSTLGLLNPDWVTVASGTSPVYPG